MQTLWSHYSEILCVSPSSIKSMDQGLDIAENKWTAIWSPAQSPPSMSYPELNSRQTVWSGLLPFSVWGIIYCPPLPSNIKSSGNTRILHHNMNLEFNYFVNVYIFSYGLLIRIEIILRYLLVCTSRKCSNKLLRYPAER